jgi:hypothetical protein
MNAVTESIPRERRGVLAAVHVDGAGKKSLKWLYRGIQKIEEPRLETQLAEGYAVAKVFSGAQVTSERLVEEIRTLTAQDSVDVVDVILSVHGDPGELVFTRADRPSAADVAAQIASPKLRFLYDTACYGSTHAAPFLEAGFQTVVGSKLKNTNGWAEYHHLIRRFIAGDTVAEAVKAADRVIPRIFWDFTSRLLAGMREVDSEKVIHGDRDLRITTPVHR